MTYESLMYKSDTKVVPKGVKKIVTQKRVTCSFITHHLFQAEYKMATELNRRLQVYFVLCFIPVSGKKLKGFEREREREGR